MDIRDRRELTALRLAAQHIADGVSASPADTVRWMLGIQAQDLPGARWSVGLRTPGATDASVAAALDSGAIVRTWPMRGTLHLVAPEDVRWMMRVAARRQATTAAARRRDLEITDSDLARAGDIAVDLMGGGRAVRRDTLLAEWERAGIATASQRGYQLIWNLAHSALIVFGPGDAKHPTFALLEEWVAPAAELDDEGALAEFAARYFRSHGPATLQDLASWASITLGDARAGVAQASGLEEREFGGVTHYLAEGQEPARAGVHLLPGFDEYLLGYRDRSGPLREEFSQRIVPGSNGIFLPTVVVDGQVVATWRRTETAKSMRIDLSPFTTLTKKGYAGYQRELKEYGRFVGKPAIAGA